MTDLWEKYAKVLVDYSVNVKKGELTIIRSGSYLAQPLVKAIYKRVLERGGYPVVRTATEGLNEIFIKNANEEQLAYVDPMTELEYEKAKNIISIGAPLNLKDMTRSDSKKTAQRSSAMRHLTEKMLKRSAEGDLNWVIADFPTNALAQEAHMSLDEYTEFLIKACYLHLDNPVEKWQEIHKRQTEIANLSLIHI